MKKLLLIPFLLFVVFANAQLLTWTPDFIQEASTSVPVTVDATYGNKGLLNYGSSVYVHIGVITNLSTSSSDWKHSKFTWGSTEAAALCTSLGNNKWKFTISGGLRTFFNITDASEKVLKIAILFRSGNGNSSIKQANTDGSDMYIPVYDNGVYTRIDDPFRQPTYIPAPEPINKSIGNVFNITSKSNVAGSLKIYFNNSLLVTSETTTATASATVTTAGDNYVVSEITSGITVKKDTIKFLVANPTVADLPAGVVDGINYDADATSATLVLYAPGKTNVYVLGEFNNWVQSLSYLMNVTPDKNRYWIKLTNLIPGTEYAYQFLIDNSIKVADYNTEKVLDPDNDKYISTTTYPNLKAYPTGKTTGIVSILQTAKPKYTWQVTNFARPDKRNLMIYELLIRDFVKAQNWQTVKDTLSYLKRLGINTIEVMPFNEFEGNNSWGYNPSFYFAPDKNYGTESALKAFIDECHKQGIAVVMDVALNHSFGQSPMVQMYWDGTKPATNSPWFNQYAKHAYNVGYDINHESQATIDFVNRFINFWLTNYKIDGFRWDLSKGFTQKQTCDNNGNNCDVAGWSAYDQSRVDIWNRYYGFMQAAAPGSYCILEHFADNSEEKVLADNGMLLWGNMNSAYNQATMGFSTNPSWDLSYGVYNNRGWSQPNLVTYMESHDEQRLQYKNGLYGNSNGIYNVKTLSTGLKRDGMAAAILTMIPGPKMIWQFGELGYDYSINTCSDGTVKSGDTCRTDPKPIKWDYYTNADRKALYDVYSKLLKLRTFPTYSGTFTSSIMNYNLGGSIKWFSTATDALRVLVVGNFDVTAQIATVTWPQTGIWYSYLTGTTLNVGSQNQSITLQPGEYYVYTDRLVNETTLPVNILSFTASKTDKKTVDVKWSTNSEINNKYYQVERSADGVTFKSLITIQPSTSTTAVKQYQFTDLHPLAGNGYYRIKQTDNDGKAHYTSVVKINFSDKPVLWQVYPNPAGSQTALYALVNLNKVQLAITDMSGKILYRGNTISSVAAGQKIGIPVLNLPKGIYLLKVVSNEAATTEKLIIE